MKKNVIPIFITFIALITFSCVNDNLEDLTLAKGNIKNNIDSTKSITFSGNILPIVHNNCMPCHGSRGSSINLTTHTGFSNNSSIILQHITSGYMPKNRTKLSSDKIQTIKNWIDDGKKNN